MGESVSTRAICVPFHRYQPHTSELYRAQFALFFKYFYKWHDEFDKLYLIDSDYNFNEEEKLFLNSFDIKYEIIPRVEQGHHWVQLKTAFPHIKEDYCLVLDNDVVIYKEGIIDGWFKEAEAGKLVTAFDGSGGMEEIMHYRYPILKQLSARRVGSYYFVWDKQDMHIACGIPLAPQYYTAGFSVPELDYTTKEGDWQDSFGRFTGYLLTKYGDSISIIEDDRSSIYINGNGAIQLDPVYAANKGYYHIRNGNLPILLMSEKIGNIPSYIHNLEISVKREVLRILAWYDGVLDLLHAPEVLDLVKDCGYTEEMWSSYIEAFREYHSCE